MLSGKELTQLGYDKMVQSNLQKQKKEIDDFFCFSRTINNTW